MCERRSQSLQIRLLCPRRSRLRVVVCAYSYSSTGKSPWPDADGIGGCGWGPATFFSWPRARLVLSLLDLPRGEPFLLIYMFTSRPWTLYWTILLGGRFRCRLVPASYA
jgi:hypothetical protein